MFANHGEGSRRVVTYFIPKRDGVRGVKRVLDNGGELFLWHAWDKLGESESFKICEI
jgi:hypothetical protein